MKRSLIKTPGLIDIFGLCILSSLAWFSPNFFGDPGVGWHLASGRWMFENLSIPYSDPFLFTTQGKAWIHNQWLSDVIFWFVYSFGDFPLIHVFALSICALPIVIIFSSLFKTQGISSIRAFFILCICILAASVQWFFRPVIWTLMFVVLLYAKLYRIFVAPSELCFKKFFWVPLMFVLWANMHPGFVVGLFVLFIALCCGFVNEYIWSGNFRKESFFGYTKSLLLVFLLSILATLINPYGIYLHSSILGLVTNSYFMKLNLEWLPPYFSTGEFWEFYVVSLVFLLMVLFGAWKKLTLFELVLAIVFMILYGMHRRYGSFYGFFLFVPLAKSLDIISEINFSWLPKSFNYFITRLYFASSKIVEYQNKSSSYFWTMLAVIVLFLYTLLFKQLPFSRASYLSFPVNYPVQAVKIIKSSEPRTLGTGRIFTSPDWGGFISWSFYRERRGFIDDRNELNGEQKYKDFFNISNAEKNWQELINYYAFEWILINTRFPVTAKLRDSNEWRLYYEQLSGEENRGLVVFRRR